MGSVRCLEEGVKRNFKPSQMERRRKNVESYKREVSFRIFQYEMGICFRDVTAMFLFIIVIKFKMFTIFLLAGEFMIEIMWDCFDRKIRFQTQSVKYPRHWNFTGANRIKFGRELKRKTVYCCSPFHIILWSKWL